MAAPAELESALKRVLSERADVAVAYLFGSRARGEAAEDSDIDIGLVYKRDGPPRGTRELIADEVAVAVSRAVGIERVDVVDLCEQGPIFCHEVLCEAVRVYEADSARRVDFESDTLVRALDFRPTYELATRGKVSALRTWLRKHHDVGTSPVEARHPESEHR